MEPSKRWHGLTRVSKALLLAGDLMANVLQIQSTFCTYRFFFPFCAQVKIGVAKIGMGAANSCACLPHCLTQSR